MPFLIILITATIGLQLVFASGMYVYGPIRVTGHLLLIISFYLIYSAIIEKGSRKPYSLLFRDLKQKQAVLCKNMTETEGLLLDILPETIANRLKKNQGIIADKFDEVTVLFADIVGFTDISSRVSAVELVILLNELFSAFDRLTRKHGLEKIKNIGDKYMVAGGIPTPRPDHAEAVAEMALDMQKEVILFNARNDRSLKIRIGINSGPVIAGVIGKRKFAYDVWGDTVNIASRMETQGLAGHIQVTKDTHDRLQNKYLGEHRGVINVKNRGKLDAYILVGRMGESKVRRTIGPKMQDLIPVSVRNET